MVDERLEKLSLQDKIKFLENLKKIKEAEMKAKEEQLKKEIDALEEKRKKELKEIEEEAEKEKKTLDEETMRTLNHMFFDERRSYSMNQARLQRTLDFGTNGAVPEQMSEMFLYNVAESMFSNPNLKLKESLSFSSYNQLRNPSSSYNSGAPSSLEQYSLETSSYDTDAPKEGGYPSAGEPSNMYSSVRNYTLDKLDKELENRRNY
jgi:hypothetical protein